MSEYLKGNQDKFGGKNVPWKNRYNLYLSRWVGTSTYYLGATPLRYIFKFTLLLKATINISGSETGVVCMCFVNCIYSVGDFQVKTLQTQIDRASHFRFFVFFVFLRRLFSQKGCHLRNRSFWCKTGHMSNNIVIWERHWGKCNNYLNKCVLSNELLLKCEDVHCWWEFAFWSLTSFGGILIFAFYTLVVKLKGKALMLEVANMQRWMLSLLIYWRCVTFSLSLLQNLKTFSCETKSKSLKSESPVKQCNATMIIKN